MRSAFVTSRLTWPNLWCHNSGVGSTWVKVGKAMCVEGVGIDGKEGGVGRMKVEWRKDKQWMTSVVKDIPCMGKFFGQKMVVSPKEKRTCILISCMALTDKRFSRTLGACKQSFKTSDKFATTINTKTNFTMCQSGQHTTVSCFHRHCKQGVVGPENEQSLMIWLVQPELRMVLYCCSMEAKTRGCWSWRSSVRCGSRGCLNLTWVNTMSVYSHVLVGYLRLGVLDIADWPIPSNPHSKYVQTAYSDSLSLYSPLLGMSHSAPSKVCNGW